MLVIYYTYCNETLPHDLFEALLRSLPPSTQTYIRKFRFAEDQCRSMYGRLLLKQALVKNGSQAGLLDQLVHDTYKRPYLATNDIIDFNITHSGNLVLCILTTDNNRLGVDTEEVKDINMSDYSSLWRTEEAAYIEADKYEDRLSRFYEIWTQKEAVIKADGRGMNLPFNEIKIDQTSQLAYVDSVPWHLYSLNINDYYKTHVAAYKPIESMRIEEVVISTFLSLT